MSTTETTLTNWDSLNTGLTSLETDLAQVKAIQGKLMTIVQGMSSSLDELMNPVELEIVTPTADDDEEVVADSVSSRAGQRTLAPLVEDEKEDATGGAIETEKVLKTPKIMHTGTFGGPPISSGSRTMPPPQLP